LLDLFVCSLFLEFCAEAEFQLTGGLLREGQHGDARDSRPALFDGLDDRRDERRGLAGSGGCFD
jgi:hypothetical protein